MQTYIKTQPPTKNMPPPSITKVFQSGNSQAVRIPADFRLDSKQVRIVKTETGGLLLEPIYQSKQQNELNKGEQFLVIMSSFDDDFVDAVAERDNDPVQEREAL